MIIYFLFFLLLFLICLYKVAYFKPVSAICISSSGSKLVSVKPNKRFFTSISQNASCAFVKIAPGLIAFYVDLPDLDPKLQFKDFSISSDVYIFKIKKGRYCSVDLSDRLLFDSVSKFIII